MCALLAVSGETIVSDPHENTGIFRIGVVKELDSAYRNFTRTGHRERRKCAGAIQQRFQQNPKLPDHHAEAGEDQKFSKLPPLHVAVFAGLYREVLLPQLFHTSGLHVYPAASMVSSEDSGGSMTRTMVFTA